MNRVRHVSELLLGRDRLPFDVEGHNANRSRGWTQYAGDGPQRRGFARTVRSDEADDFTRVHGETQVAYRSELAVVPGEIFDLNHRSVELLQEESQRLLHWQIMSRTLPTKPPTSPHTDQPI